MQVVITVWLENHSKVKQYRPTNWPTNQKTDQQTDEQTDQPTDQLTKWLIESRARDYKAILLRSILVLKEYWILLTGVDWDWRGESGRRLVPGWLSKALYIEFEGLNNSIP